MYTKQGRMILKDGKELFYIQRVNKGNNCYDMTPCECDAMSYFILEVLNKGNFEAYYKEYMEK